MEDNDSACDDEFRFPWEHLADFYAVFRPRSSTDDTIVDYDCCLSRVHLKYVLSLLCLHLLELFWCIQIVHSRYLDGKPRVFLPSGRVLTISSMVIYFNVTSLGLRAQVLVMVDLTSHRNGLRWGRNSSVGRGASLLPVAF